MEMFNPMLFVILSGLLILDFVTTHYLVKRYGISAEKNPIIREVAAKPAYHAIYKLIAIIFAFILLLISYLFPFFIIVSLISVILMILIIAYGIAQINNIVLILRKSY